MLLVSALGSLSIKARSQPVASAEKISLWDQSFHARAGAGYKDNPLLSSVKETGSPFLSAGLDAMFFRIPLDGTEFYCFVTGDEYHYLRNIGMHDEQTLISAAKLLHRFASVWEAGLGAQYFYQNEVFDVSSTEARLTTLKLEGHSLQLAPSIQRQLGKHYRLRLELAFRRQFLKAPLDGYWEGGPRLTLERPYGNHSLLSFDYHYTRRFYDQRQVADPQGFPLPGPRLVFDRHTFDLGQRHYWDAHRHWRTDSKVGFELNLDNGSGFFDYYRCQLSEQLRYQTKSWNLKARVRLNYYRYPVQQTAFSSGAKRRRTDLEFSLRGERRLYKELTGYVEYAREDNLSNRAANSYHVNTLLAGLEWGF